MLCMLYVNVVMLYVNVVMLYASLYRSSLLHKRVVFSLLDHLEERESHDAVRRGDSCSMFSDCNPCLQLNLEHLIRA